MTIRTRLTFLYSSLLAIVILMFSAATSSVLNWALRNQVDNTLYKAVDEARDDLGLMQAMPDRPPMWPVALISSPNTFVQVWLHNEKTGPFVYGESLNMVGMHSSDAMDAKALSQADETRRDVVINGDHLRVLTMPLKASNGQIFGYVQAASSLRTVDAAMDRLLKIMLVSGTIALLASLLLGDMMSQRALKPIDAITQTAQQITAADDLSRRIPYHGPPDEIGQLTQTFNETLERLERLFKSQRRFVADVSHEMRTPLTTIQGNIDLMRRFGYDEEAMEAIEGEARRMSRLVGDLLLLAKADSAQLSLEKTRLELDTLVLETYNQAHVLSDGVEVRLGNIDQVQVMGDPDRLKQLLLNLVSNGLKYTPAGGSVTIGLARDEQWAYITVSDTGIGIPQEDLPHIFDRFYRVDKARSRVMGGTGLGLSIAKWIAEAHGGQIAVRSTVGEGSTFTVNLPLILPNAPADSLRETRPSLSAIRLRAR